MDQSASMAQHTGDSLLAEIMGLYDLVDSSSRLHQWYHTEKPEQAMQLAARAEKAYLEELKSLEADGSASIECLRKLALAAQFQNGDFSYQKALPPTYEKAMGYIKQAIVSQQKMPLSDKLAELYETAARVAIPHFFFGYQSEISQAAEREANQYLELAYETYLVIGKEVDALRVMRDLDNNTIKFLLRKLLIAKSVEGRQSLAMAKDIAELMHELVYQTPQMEDLQAISEYAALGHKIYQTHELSKDEAQLHSSLLYDAGYYFKMRMSNLDTSTYYLRQAQAVEEKWGMEVDYTAFQLAANCIEQQQWVQATAQYDKALTSPRIAIIDVEQAYFGKAMVAWITGEKQKAVQIWRQHIRDQEIMNGVSGYQSRFMPENKSMIRENALALIAAVGAPNARRIVEGNWLE